MGVFSSLDFTPIRTFQYSFTVFLVIRVLTWEGKEMRRGKQDATNRSFHPSQLVSTVALGYSLSLSVTCTFQVISYKLKPVYMYIILIS